MKNIRFVCGYGQAFSRKGSSYPTITMKQIINLVEHPECKPKAKATWFIPSSYSEGWARRHEVQLEAGAFYCLTVDIDEGNPAIDEVVGSIEAILGDVHMLVYSSSGATQELRKWRALVPLNQAMNGYEWMATQEIFFDRLEKERLNVDRALKRPGQLVFLPNIPPGRRDSQGMPEFYKWRKIVGVRYALS